MAGGTSIQSRAMVATSKDITPGNFDVINVEKVDVANNWIYFEASPDDATRRFLFRAPLTRLTKDRTIDPSQPTRLACLQHFPSRRSGDSFLFSVHESSVHRDGETCHRTTVARSLIDNRAVQQRMDALKPTPYEFFKVDIGEGVELDGWMIKPPDFDRQKRYPVLFYAYTEPWSQTVVDAWGGLNLRWHMMLAQQGYLVMSVDNRGTPAPRGRAWRKIIYRKMGIVNSLDQANAARAIRNGH